MIRPGIRFAISASSVAACLLTGSAATAQAATPTGTCTSSYKAYTFGQLSFDQAAQAIFPVLDANGDGLVCFKPYPNGDHAGHAGNLVDDKAAPHA